jgi:hypothetical protein
MTPKVNCKGREFRSSASTPTHSLDRANTLESDAGHHHQDPVLLAMFKESVIFLGPIDHEFHCARFDISLRSGLSVRYGDCLDQKVKLGGRCTGWWVDGAGNRNSMFTQAIIFMTRSYIAKRHMTLDVVGNGCSGDYRENTQLLRKEIMTLSHCGLDPSPKPHNRAKEV